MINSDANKLLRFTRPLIFGLFSSSKLFGPIECEASGRVSGSFLLGSELNFIRSVEVLRDE